MNGQYVKMFDSTFYGRAVYAQASGSNYLYFWDNSKDWFVGPSYPSYNSVSVGLASDSDSNAQCPEAAGSSWVYSSGGGNMQSGVVQVKPSKLHSCLLGA